MMIVPTTPLKFTAKGGVAYAGRGKWHLPIDGQPGAWMRDYKTTPILCERGYHWCEARYAIHHLHDECWLIEPRGETVIGDDKRVSQGGRLLARVETWNERTMRLFACDCAEAVAHLAGNSETVCRATIAIARWFAQGEATPEERAAAWAAARDAAWDVASAAASAAARAAAWDVARNAARAAARDAAWAAARDVARAAVSAAARAAAWDVARAAAWADQSALLLRYLNGEIGR